MANRQRSTHGPRLPQSGSTPGTGLQVPYTLPTAAASPISFALIFQEYAGYVMGLLRRLRVAESDLEDVAQEVFLTIHMRLPSFEARSTVKTWVCGICLRKASDYRRKAYRRRELPTAVPPEPVALDTQWGSEEHLMRREQVELLDTALSTLSPKQLDVFVLFEIEELPMLEVARAVGCPRFTAYNRLRTARREIRAFFERRGQLSRPAQQEDGSAHGMAADDEPQQAGETELDSTWRGCV